MDSAIEKMFFKSDKDSNKDNESINEDPEKQSIVTETNPTKNVPFYVRKDMLQNRRQERHYSYNSYNTSYPSTSRFYPAYASTYPIVTRDYYYQENPDDEEKDYPCL